MPLGQPPALRTPEERNASVSQIGPWTSRRYGRNAANQVNALLKKG